MLRTLLRALRRPRTILLALPYQPLALPPVARTFLPHATAAEAITYNRTRKATAITLLLFRTGRTATCPTADIETAAAALGWPPVSPETRAAVRAHLGVLHADRAIHQIP
ncbi:hypothetical protein AB0G73_24365 [Streptomyces sp. NPDC020719]|uniref:hypothetical protein n=1 Tax=Streptomyces sp. NPDC020719 TaxID=3154896 RepID=UPI0034018583